MVETITFLGKEMSLYYLFWFLALPASMIIGCLIRKNYNFSFSKCILYIVFDFVFAYLFIWVTSWIFGGGDTNGFNFVRIVSFVPLYMWLLAYVFKDPYWKVADFLVPVGSIFVGVSHLGCIFSGCCHGYPSQWGLYSNIAGTICFPIQPIESITSIAIGVLLLVMAKRGIQEGRLYIWYMILFGGTRFLLEFFRDNEKVLGNISELALHALAAMLLGIAAFVITNWYSKGVHSNEKN